MSAADRFELLLGLLHLVGVETGQRLAVVRRSREKSVTHQCASYEVGGDAMPGRERVFCDSLERDAGRGELRGVELRRRYLVSAILAQQERRAGRRGCRS